MSGTATTVAPGPPDPAGRGRPREADPVAGRVRAAQAAARDGLAVAGLFAVCAAVALAAGWPGRWAVLHLFLAGSVASAISGATVLLAVTWSAGPAPSPARTRTQLGAVGLGAAGVVAARTAEAPAPAVGAAAALFAAGLALLAVLVAGAVRQGVQRRFDVSCAWYVAALCCGVAAAGFGAAMATGHGPAGARDAHVALNLLGLVGLVVGGTVPLFAATLARTKMSRLATPGRRAALLAWQVAALAVVVPGALARSGAAQAAGLAAYAAGVVVLVALLPRPTRRQLAWAGPRLPGLHLALAWWVGALAAAAARAAAGEAPLAGPLLLALAAAGLGQLVWASASYLVPVVRAGGHELLAAGFRQTRSWPALAAWNAAGLLFALGATSAAGAAVAVAVADTAVRQAPLLRRPPATPARSPSSATPTAVQEAPA